jgi:hypothetical protein
VSRSEWPCADVVSGPKYFERRRTRRRRIEPRRDDHQSDQEPDRDALARPVGPKKAKQTPRLTVISIFDR